MADISRISVPRGHLLAQEPRLYSVCRALDALAAFDRALQPAEPFATDENGHRLFTDEDAEALGEKSGVALDRVWEVAQRINALRKEDVEALGKPSTQTPS